MDKELSVHITTTTIIKTILIILGFVAAWFLRDLLLVLLTSIVIASSIEPAAKGLAKWKVPRTPSVLIVYTAFFAVFFVVIFFFLPPVMEDTSEMLSSLPDVAKTLESPSQSGDSIAFLTKNLSLSNAITELNTAVASFKDNIFSIVHVVFGGLVSFVLIIVFSFYFAVNEGGIEEFLRVITPLQHEKYVISLWRRSQKKIGLWMQGQFLLALIIGVLVYLGMAILGIPHALVLAVIAAVFELIPLFGPVLAAVPAIALAFTTGGVGLAAGIALFYVIIQQFENHLIYPLVVTKVVGVPPILVILALVIGVQMGGMIGALLAVPIAAVVQELFADMDKHRQKAIKQGK